MDNLLINELKKAEKTIGKNELLSYLKRINSNDKFEFELIKSLLLQYYEISEHEFYHSNRTRITAAKQIAAYLLHRKTKYSDKEICKFLNISERTYFRYRKNMFEIIVNPVIYKDLYKSYFEILKIFNEKIEVL